MTSVAEQSIQPFLSGAARASEAYTRTMRAFYDDGVCGRYPALLTEIAAAATRHAPTLALEFRITAREELCGARIIAHAAETVEDTELRDSMRRHAEDENRHSRMFHALVEQALPGTTALPIQDTDASEELGPGFNDVEGFLISIHLAEIRSQLIVSEFKEQIDRQKPEGHLKMSRALDAVLADEGRHIHYTSERVADWIERDPAYLEKLEHYIPIYDGYWWSHVEVLSGSLANRQSGT
jgi:rubrerythrin